MKRAIFITGIPAAGKSYLGAKLAKEVGGVCVSIDDIREDLRSDERFLKWVDFYWDQDEYQYYTKSNYEEQWNNLVKQSEALWPGVIKKIRNYENESKPVIFEGVNILPHLAHKDLKFSGIGIVGKSFDEIFERNKKEPRWGKTEELQRLEADAFFNGERPHYRKECEKYGYKVFETAEEAWDTALQLLR